MGISSRRQIVFILAFALFSWAIFCGQDKSFVDKKDKRLREEILSVYEDNREGGLRNFIKEKKDKVTNKFIVDFTESGVKERKEQWLKACMIMAEEKKDQKALADVYYNMGEYFRLISNNKKAADYFDKALPLYVRINDLVGQGNVYLRKGIIFYSNGDQTKAFDMYARALSFFKNARDIRGQGNVYWRKGNIYLYNGNKSNALKMYKKALPLLEKSGDLVGLGNVYLSKGDYFSLTGNDSIAFKFYDKALNFFEKAGDFLGIGNVHHFKGITYLNKGDVENALEMFDKALSFYEKAKDPLSRGDIYRAKGLIHFHTGNISKSLVMYDKALYFFEKFREPFRLGNVYYEKGECYSQCGDRIRAVEMYDKAISFFEKAGYFQGLGDAFRGKCAVYSRNLEYSKAFKMYDNALPFYEKVGDFSGQGNVYLGKALIHFYMGKNSNAREMFEKALTFFEKGKDQLGQANVYYFMGEFYLLTSDRANALKMYNKALPLFEKEREFTGQGNVYRSKGYLFSITGEISKALELYDKAQHLSEKAEDLLGQGNTFRKKGDIYFIYGDNTRAFELYVKALPFFEKSGDLLDQGNVYYGMGDIYLDTGDNKKALEMYEKALTFYEKGGEMRGQGNVYRKKGDIYFQTIELSKALKMYNKALHLFEEVEIIESESLALHSKAKVMVKLGKMDDALDLFEKGIAKLEKVRTQTVFSEMKRTFMENAYDQYGETAIFMLNNKYYDKGFKCAGSIKARVFLEKMVEGLVPLEKGVTPEKKLQRDKLVSKLSILGKKMNDVASKNDDKKLKDLKNQYRKIENEFEDLLVKIRLENPLYASVKYPGPIDLQILQKNYLKKDEMMLHYFVPSEKIYVFLVSKVDFKVVPLEFKEEAVNKLVNRYLLALTSQKFGSMMNYGKALYKSLFKPVEGAIKGNKNLIIVPDGQLATIPFESFVIDNDQSDHPVYLVEKFRIKYIQSASVLATMRKHYKRTSKTKHFIGFGDPVYDFENYKKGLPEKGSPEPGKGDEIKEIHRGKYDREGGVLDRLQDSGQEVEAIAGLLKKQNQKCVVHLREQANEENAKSLDLKEFDYIHFSCHGILGDGFQSLVLSQIPNAKEDGYLTLNEIMNCDYNAKLVVLSACKTGSGKLERGEGVTGLTRAVMYAGTPAVVASLWNVRDIATKELMVKFYTYMIEKGKSKEEALRKAKLDMIKSKEYSSPYFWSAFVMYGE